MEPGDVLNGALDAIKNNLAVIDEVFKHTAELITRTATNTLAAMENAAPSTQPLSTTSDTSASSTKPESGKPKERKKGRDRTDCKKNVTVSLSLDDENEKSEIDTPLLYNAYHYVRTGAPAPKFVTTGLKIDDELTALETNIKNEEAGNNDADIIEGYHIRKVELTRHQIIEHAARRADLFLYLLIAVYGKHVIAEKIETTKQHGKGNEKRGTAGCHSSLFPGIKFTHISAAQPGFFNSKQGDCPLLKDTYFDEALNSTVELPKLVNDLDGHIEGRFEPSPYVKRCLDIINDVAVKKIDPKEGMNQYYQAMNGWFGYFEGRHIITNRKAKLNNWRALKLIWEYEKLGTFSGANDDLTIKKDYLHMMLKINSITDALPYDHYYSQIQHELLTSCFTNAVEANESTQKRQARKK